MKKKKKNHGLRRVGEIMDDMDTPHGDFDLTGQFARNGASAPAGPKASHPLLSAFSSTFEPVSSEHLAHEVFTTGRLREYFQAWIVPKMPDPLPVYLDELDCMGFAMRTSFDGSPCILVRYRGAVDAVLEEVEKEEEEESTHPPAFPEEVMAYTDDWEDDLSDIPPFQTE